jgi:hypothetical protein
VPARRPRLGRNAVIDGIEDPADWKAIRDGVRESFEPADYAEELIAERIALNLWKRRRVDVYQAATARKWINVAYSHLQVVGAYAQGTLAKGEMPEPDERDLYIEERVRLLGMSDDIQRVMRYDAHLHRQTLQLMHELEAMQARRRGENAPLASRSTTACRAPDPESCAPPVYK